MITTYRNYSHNMLVNTTEVLMLNDHRSTARQDPRGSRNNALWKHMALGVCKYGNVGIWILTALEK